MLHIYLKNMCFIKGVWMFETRMGHIKVMLLFKKVLGKQILIICNHNVDKRMCFIKHIWYINGNNSFFIKPIFLDK